MPEHNALPDEAGADHPHHHALSILGILNVLHGLVEPGIKGLAFGGDFRHTQVGKGLQKALEGQLDAGAEVLVLTGLLQRQL